MLRPWSFPCLATACLLAGRKSTPVGSRKVVAIRRIIALSSGTYMTMRVTRTVFAMHQLIDDRSVDHSDAMFMLVTCSALINLIRARQNQI
jgi:hypothetical protein